MAYNEWLLETQPEGQREKATDDRECKGAGRSDAGTRTGGTRDRDQVNTAEPGGRLHGDRNGGGRGRRRRGQVIDTRAKDRDEFFPADPLSPPSPRDIEKKRENDNFWMRESIRVFFTGSINIGASDCRTNPSDCRTNASDCRTNAGQILGKKIVNK